VFERFTDRARRVVVLASEEARLLSHNYIGTEHLLLGLVREGEGIAAQVLADQNVSPDRVREAVEKRIGQGGSTPTEHIPFTPRAKTVLELSLREALQLGHNYIGTEHILLGLVREGEGVAALTLQEFGLELEAVRDAVLDRVSWVGAAGETRPPSEEARPVPPTCPGCFRSLSEGMAAKTLPVRRDDAAGEERGVLTVYCGHCGRTLGIIPD
jgi:ATP-dependent Clp protease ATP-binding subunit ClpC